MTAGIGPSLDLKLVELKWVIYLIYCETAKEISHWSLGRSHFFTQDERGYLLRRRILETINKRTDTKIYWDSVNNEIY